MGVFHAAKVFSFSRFPDDVNDNYELNFNIKGEKDGDKVNEAAYNYLKSYYQKYTCTRNGLIDYYAERKTYQEGYRTIKKQLELLTDKNIQTVLEKNGFKIDDDVLTKTNLVSYCGELTSKVMKKLAKKYKKEYKEDNRN